VGQRCSPLAVATLSGESSESGQHCSCSGIPCSSIQHNPSEELRTSLQRDSSQSQYKCARRVRREYAQEKPQHVRWSRNGTNIFPGRLYCSFHNPLYEAKATQHMGLELGLWTPSALCSFSPFTTCLTGGLVLLLPSLICARRHSCAHSPKSVVVWIKRNETCKRLAWHIINAQ